MTCANLGCAQARIASSLDDTCTVQRRSKVFDSRGGFVITYATLATDVPCRVSPAKGAFETVVAGKVVSVYDVVFTFASTQDVIETDRLIWQGRTHEVTKPRYRTNQISLRVEAKEIK